MSFRPPRSLAIASIPIVAFLVVPLAMLILSREPTGLATGLGTPVARQALFLSVWTSAVSLGIVVAFGLPLALLLARHAFRGRRLLDSIVDLPVVLPPAVAGIALLLTFGRNGPLGPLLARYGIEIVFTPAAVVMAQAFVSSPYFVRSATNALRAIPREVEEATTIDGASGWRAFWSVLAPMTSESLLGGAAMAWSRALGEFGATLLFAGNLPGHTQTMPLAIYLGFESGDGAPIALSIVLVGVAFATLATTRWLVGRTQR